MKNIQVPDYLAGVVNNTRDAFCDMLTNPTLWSESLIKDTLKRTGGQAFNINDVQTIIQNYLNVLSEHIREGRTIK
ncbi:MAG: hypothetical protein Kow0037_04870 [Calditrichia bacterium]